MDRIHPEHLNYGQIQSVADKFLEKYYPSLELPIPIEKIVEIDLGIKLSTEINLREEIGVDGFINSNNEIIIDDYVFNNYVERTRFTIAHELGHKLLHYQIYQSQKMITKEDYLQFQNMRSDEDQKWLEIQAHAFAGNLLVPTKKLKEELAEIIRKNSGKIDFAMPYLIDLPLKFKVSSHVILRRLEKEKLISEDDFLLKK